MASWKKVIVSGSDARLGGVGVGVDPTAGQISASGKIFATTTEGAGLSTYNVVIKGADGEFKHTSSLAISPTIQPLSFPAAGGLKLDSGTTYDGSAERSASIDSGSLAGAGLTVGTQQIDVGQGNNITVATDDIHVNTGSLVDDAKGLSADASDISGLTATKIGVNIGAGLAFGTDGVIDASFVAGAALTDGDGIVDFSYDGSTGVTIGVDSASIAGTGLDATTVSQKIILAGSNGLSSGNIPKWTGTAFADSKISETATTVTLGSGTDEVVIPGNLTVSGTASFQHSSDVSIGDPFFLMASGSTTDTSFGIVGQTGSTANASVGWVYEPQALGATGGRGARWTFTTGSNVTTGGGGGGTVGAASVLVNSTDTTAAAADTYMGQTGNMLIDSSDNIYLYF